MRSIIKKAERFLELGGNLRFGKRQKLRIYRTVRHCQKRKRKYDCKP